MPETSLVQRIRQHANNKTDTRLFRNNVGLLKLPNGKRLRYGLHEGSADLIGWKTVEITPDMVGKRVAIFLSVEVKTRTGQKRDNQKIWCGTVRAFGGIAGFVKSEEELDELLKS
jgi:hypothetical protein